MYFIGYDAKIKHFSITLASSNWVNDTSGSSGTYYYDFSSQIPGSISSGWIYDIVSSSLLYAAMVLCSTKALYVEYGTKYLRFIDGNFNDNSISIGMIAYKAEEVTS